MAIDKEQFHFIIHITTENGHSERKMEVSPFVMGRSDTCHVTIPYIKLSRKHIKVWHENNVIYISDLGSKNGTYINGERLVAQNPTVVTPLTKIVLGDENAVEIKLELKLEHSVVVNPAEYEEKIEKTEVSAVTDKVDGPIRGDENPPPIQKLDAEGEIEVEKTQDKPIEKTFIRDEKEEERERLLNQAISDPVALEERIDKATQTSHQKTSDTRVLKKDEADTDKKVNDEDGKIHIPSEIPSSIRPNFQQPKLPKLNPNAPVPRSGDVFKTFGLRKGDVLGLIGALGTDSVKSLKYYVSNSEKIYEKAKEDSETIYKEAKKQAKAYYKEVSDYAKELKESTELKTKKLKEKTKAEVEKMLLEAEALAQQKVSSAKEQADKTLNAATGKANEAYETRVKEAEAISKKLTIDTKMLTQKMTEEAHAESTSMLEEAKEKLSQSKSVLQNSEQQAREESERIIKEANVTSEMILNEVKEEKQRINEEMQEVQNKIESCNSEIEKLKSITEQHKDEEAALSEKLILTRADFQQEEQNLKSLLKEIEQTNSEHQADIDGKSKKYDELSALVENKNEELHHAEEIISELIEKEVELNEKIQEMNEAIPKLNDEYSSLTSKRNSEQVRLDDLFTRASNIESTIEQLTITKQEETVKLNDMKEKALQEINDQQHEARKTVDEIITNAEKQASNQLKEADKKAKSLLSESEIQAEKLIKTASSKLEEAGTEAKKVLEAAQGDAQKVKKQAQKQAEELEKQVNREKKNLLSDARKEESEILSRAHSKSDELLREAEKTSQLLIDEKRSEAKEILAEAQSKMIQLKQNTDQIIDDLNIKNKNKIEKLLSEAKIKADSNLVKAQKAYDEAQIKASELIEKAKQESESVLGEVTVKSEKITKEADDYSTDLRKQSEEALSKAKRQADEVVSMAEQQARELESKAQANANDVLKKAVMEAESLAADATNRADSMVKSAEDDSTTRRMLRLKELEFELESQRENQKQLLMSEKRIMLEDIKSAVFMKVKNYLADPSNKQALEMLSVEIDQAAERAVLGVDFDETELSEHLKKDPLLQKKRTQKFWRRVAGVSATMIFLAVISPMLLTQFEEGARDLASQKSTASDLYVDHVNEQIKNKPKFAPEKTTDYLESYTDRVLYTDGYVSRELDPTYREEWILKLNDYFVDKLRLSENAIVPFIAQESNLVRELHDEYEKINMDFIESGEKRMRDREEQFNKEVLRVLKSKSKFKKFLSYKKNFYEAYYNKKSK